MKKGLLRIVAFSLSLVMLIGSLPIMVFASEPSMALIVNSQTGMPGETVQVTVDFKNNPGLTSLKFYVAYDSALTLKNVEFNSAFGSYVTAPEPYTNPQPITMISPLAEIDANGTFATLTFEISKNVPDNYVANVTVAYEADDVFDENGNNVGLTIVNGNITVYHGVPGDIDGDSKVNTKDAVLLFRFVAGWNVDVDSTALDVNGDNKINTKDAVALFRYVAGWENIILYRGEICTHDLIHSAAKDATCTEDGQIEFWYCELCGRIYSDESCNTQITKDKTIVPATGHNTVIDNAVEATHTSTGLTQGSHCDICNTVLVEQQIIPIISGTNYGITYDLFGGDTYLATVGVTNNNPDTYVSEVGLQLEDLSSPGYVFKGWKTSDGTQISEITVNTTGNKTLYAQWEKVVYTVTFDTPDVDVLYTWYDASKGVDVTLVNQAKYTVDTGLTVLTNPDTDSEGNDLLYGYSFVGWSNDDGFVVSKIKPGTTGNITLHANWTSERNKAVSYDKYEKPIIIEDSTTGQFLFVYNIGRIENVPLYQIGWIGNVSKVDTTLEFTYTDTVSSEQAELIANSISNATTRSSGWTLSEEWNQIYMAEEENQDVQIKSEERTDSEGNTVGGNYFVSNSNGGSTYVSNESGGSSSSSSKVTTDKSAGISGSYDTSNEKYADGKVSVKNTTEISAGVSLPVKVVDVSAGIKNTTEVGADFASGRKDNEATHVEGYASSYIGTVDINNSSSYYTTIKNNSNSWNSEEGYEKSQEISTNTQIAAAISSQILESTKYSLTKALAGDNSQTSSIGEEEIASNEYQTTLKYYTGSSSSQTMSKTLYYDEAGWYRYMMAGTVHVYGVVGYDTATGSYYTYTFNVLDDKTYEFMDFSRNSQFDDCENGVVTFEIPYEVNEYIVGITGRTDGVEVNLDGTITGFEAPEKFDGTVVIPQYYSVNNGDNTYTAYQTKAIDANAFRGNTSIKTVILPIYITEIPDNAFEGCTNLETVIAYGVKKIGNSAFKGCTSLKTFSIDNIVESIGEKAFEDCPEIKAMAVKKDVAIAVINSGAKRITLDLTKMTDAFDAGYKIEFSDSTEYFALYGGGKSFTNLQIESDATETFISNITFTGNTDTPIKLSSNTITLARVTVEDAPGFALIIESANADVKLLGDINLRSKSTNAVISKNVTFSKMKVDTAGNLIVTGKYLVCGTITNDNMLTASNGVEQIDEDTFNSMLTSSTVTFDANGGSVSESSKTVYYGQYYGVLPTPTRANYTFEGWYSEAKGGTQITADSIVTALVNQTLYAHWEPKTFTVSFNANGGSVSPSSKSVTYNSTYGSLPTPTRTGHTFVGWYTASNEGSKVGTDTMVTATANHTLYARWNAISYKASWSVAAHTGITVTRTSSPYAGAGTGALSNGATVYYGDVLSVSYSASTGFSLISKGATTITVTGDVTSSNIYATAKVNSYTVRWSVGTGTTITVKRTSSPHAGATIGTLSNGGTIYYGDVLSIIYAANTGYTLSSKGSTSITVAGNVTSSNIYAAATPNSYTYNIVYKSSNGTSLGTSSATHAYGTTNTISPKTFAGYTAPATQSVSWDSTSAKTITFVYTPMAATNDTKTGTISKEAKLTYTANIEYRNRTANSVEIRVVWKTTLGASKWMRNGLVFTASVGTVTTGKVTAVPWNTWTSEKSSARSNEVASGWIKISLNTTNSTSVSMAIHAYQINSAGTNITNVSPGYAYVKTTWTVNIPAY